MATVHTEDKIEEQVNIEEPRKYKVILHNDDKTTFDFVIYVLQAVFFKTLDDAVELTKHIHVSGSAIVGVYTKEIAEEKTLEAMTLARGQGFPLAVTYEEL